MAAPPSMYQNNKLKVAAILISFLAFFPSKPVVLGLPGYKTGRVNERDENLQVGSRPPACVNKCSSCRPCKAILVIQPPQQQRQNTSSSHDGDDDIYYLLSWKCKCGNKLYRP